MPDFAKSRSTRRSDPTRSPAAPMHGDASPPQPLGLGAVLGERIEPGAFGVVREHARRLGAAQPPVENHAQRMPAAADPAGQLRIVQQHGLGSDDDGVADGCASHAPAAARPRPSPSASRRWRWRSGRRASPRASAPRTEGRASRTSRSRRSARGTPPRERRRRRRRPARRSRRMPRPRTRGFGSSVPTTTRDTADSSTASTQGGVRPKWQTGLERDVERGAAGARGRPREARRPRRAVHRRWR